MLNYIRAELYRARHHTATYLVFAGLPALELLFAWSFVVPSNFADLVGLLCLTLPTGLFLGPVVDLLVCAGQYRSGILKNELSFGIPRRRIYLGRLFTALLLALGLCALAFTVFLGRSWLFAPRAGAEETAAALSVLGYVTAASLPLWLGTLGLSHALLSVCRNEILAICLLCGLFAVGWPFLSMLSLLNMAPVSQIAAFLLSVLPTAPFGMYTGPLTASLMVRCWAIGLGWLAASTAAGLLAFSHREIK